MKRFLSISLLLVAALTTQAKIWRVNNTAGVTADFTQISNAMSSASVLAGDTLHVEASLTNYGGFNLSKQLVIIGSGYLLDSSLAHPNKGNAGLQPQTYGTKVSSVTCQPGGNGSVVMGLEFVSVLYFGNGGASNNLNFIKCRFTSAVYPNTSNTTWTNIAFRKCLFSTSTFDLTLFNGTSAANITLENCIFYNSHLITTGYTTGCIIRNCTFEFTGNYNFNIVNAYFANNIVSHPSVGFTTYTSSTVKNNIFSNNPSLPSGASGNQVNVPLSNVCLLTGSSDGRYQLAPASPAIAAGVTINSYTPDLGAFGGPDPYKLSGIPSVPSIYQLSVPATIPLGTPSMTITFSTRDNN